MKIYSPAKVNIRLKVIGRRPDGYHELVSIMAPVALYDTIELTALQEEEIRFSCQGRSVPENDGNIVWRAAKAFFSETELKKGVFIRLSKYIPVAAGLGGGSSNAACTLKALNDLWGNPLGFQQLAELAVSLGADVPFFLYEGPCIAKGIGEILEPITNWPKLWYVIIMPPIQVSTAWVYSNLKIKLTPKADNDILNELINCSQNFAGLLENDLERVTAFHFPVIETIKKALVDTGAEGALMSGSGPSVFGVFKTKDHAQWAKERLSSKNLGEVFAVEGL